MNGKPVRVNVIAPAELWRRFDKVAKANQRSRSGHLRSLMEREIREHEKGAA